MNRSIFYTWQSFKKFSLKKKIILNFGPQHPAAHGVLRLILQLEGEYIFRTDIHIGLLHRGTESLIEKKFFEKSIPYFDRLDYVSMMSQEHAYCLSIENLLKNFDVNFYTSFVRILFDELTRVLNHMLAISCHALDIGSMSSLFWAFEEREKLMEFYERASGARMHAAFHRPGFLFKYFVDHKFLMDILLFVQSCFKTLNEMHNVLTFNKIWKTRLINIGNLSIQDCQNYNLTGVLARSAGLKKDLRISYLNNYSNYNLLKINSFCGLNGDTYDRYLIRMLEMGESLSIINTIIKNFLFKFSNQFTQNYVNNILNKNSINQNKHTSYSSMEDLINHFLRWNSGFSFSRNIELAAIESPKGEFGVMLISNDSVLPQKCKIKSPSYFNLQFLTKLCSGHYLADLSTLIGTIDIVFGEVDR